MKPLKVKIRFNLRQFVVEKNVPVPAGLIFTERVALSGLVIFICYPGLLPWAEMSRVVGAQSLFPPNKT